MNLRRIISIAAGLCFCVVNVNAFELIFKARVDYQVETYPCSVYGADFDGDGAPDLAAVNSGSNTSVSILKNNGNGTFAAASGFHVFRLML